MDLNLARTFLEIVRSGSFIAAAEKLHVTQTTVTARVHNLEGQLGCKLFIRNRSGASLTADGQRFIEHASKLVQSWEAAKRDLPLPAGTRQVLNIGGEISLWSPVMLQWLNTLNIAESELAVRAEIDERQSLMQKLEHGVLDIVVVHQPEYWPGIQVEELLEEKLIMVASNVSPEPYVYIDWGEEFRKQHDVALPEFSRAKLTVNLGPLALHYILENGGSGYFRTRVVEQHIRAGLLERKSEYPEFTFPAYVLYRKSDRDRFHEQITALFDSSRMGSGWF
ncbi:LysR family transcriptional regulator [Methylophaga sp.]|jgi:DNA-binding transcriptional LysR family regulator|uniref:LysR family transcriptional regulator n=1 Tax=Methylophaga sp. TaxID=2024840 RepID=UPI0014003977|nr:LysR family transcriptional regulator [Methylophaga sp.]MTI64763.1 LysR family transcriptional regulator [Methylophaga sp.]